MSTPTQPMLSAEIRAEIAGFVAAVEHELDDLPTDDVAELTGGLEADLIEAWAAEGTTPRQRFGSPSAYAAELRSAAGLSARGRRAPRFAVDLRQVSARGRESVGTAPGGRQLLQWADELQPAWWVIRAVGLLPFVVWPFFSWDTVGQVLLAITGLALVIWSMRLRSAGAAADRVRMLVLVWNAAAVFGLLLVPGAFDTVFGHHGNFVEYSSDSDVGEFQSPGIALNGQPVTNVFAYDENGKLIQRVRLYDQDGHPMYIDSDNSYDVDGNGQWVPNAEGPRQWNLYPLVLREENYNGDGEPELGAVQPLVPPFQEVGPLPSGDKVTVVPSAAASAQPDQAEDGQ